MERAASQAAFVIPVASRCWCRVKSTLPRRECPFRRKGRGSLEAKAKSRSAKSAAVARGRAIHQAAPHGRDLRGRMRQHSGW